MNVHIGDIVKTGYGVGKVIYIRHKKSGVFFDIELEDSIVVVDANDIIEIIEDTFSGIKFYENGKETYSIDTKPSFTTKDLHIEEDNKIEKLDLFTLYEKDMEKKEILQTNFRDIKDKINEIIEVLNERGFTKNN